MNLNSPLIYRTDKRCYYCKTVKPRDRFCRDRSQPDGLSSRCKDCDPIIAAERHHRLTKFTESYKRGRRIAQSRYRRRYPEKIKAQQMAQRIPLAASCSNCGSVDDLHRHHPDYAKPLEVETLCGKCHRRVHHG